MSDAGLPMQGRLFCNGNIQREVDLIQVLGSQILQSRHQNPSISRSKKCLLVTAGWLENEYREQHLKQALAKLGIPMQLNRQDNVQNLSLYHLFQEFLEEYPDFRARWNEREHLVEAARSLYLEKNGFFVDFLRRSLSNFREYFPALGAASTLEKVLAAIDRAQPLIGSALGRQRLGTFLAKNINSALHSLQENDDSLVHLLRDIEEEYVVSTGLYFHQGWQKARQELQRRILSANSIFIFGGHMAEMHRCFSFFRLGEVLEEALRCGASFYTVSAGSLILCERVILFNDFAYTDLGAKREFQLFDRGFSLVPGMQLFPHCTDRIQTDDTDNLAYLALRFRNRVCVGLNEGSILSLERSKELNYAWEAKSVGHSDGVYVFDSAGQKLCYRAGELIPNS